MLLLRDIQKDTGGFTEFVPLGFIHSETRLYQKGGARAGASFSEDLIVHALARLLLNDHIPNVQVSWVKLGFDGALACLEAGANDFSGTLMEESISKAAGADYGELVLPGELRSLIRSIGRVPAERYTTYDIRKVFAEPDADERLPVERLPDAADAGRRRLLGDEDRGARGRRGRIEAAARSLPRDGPGRSDHHRQHRRRHRHARAACVARSRHHHLHARGRGERGDTAGASPAKRFRVAEGLARYGRPVWFKLGDRDLATHIHRSALLQGRRDAVAGDGVHPHRARRPRAPAADER